MSVWEEEVWEEEVWEEEVWEEEVWDEGVGGVEGMGVCVGGWCGNEY